MFRVAFWGTTALTITAFWAGVYYIGGVPALFSVAAIALIMVVVVGRKT